MTKPRSACRKSRWACFPAAAARSAWRGLLPTGDALQFLFKGEQIKAKVAKAAGLVHELAPEGEIVERARAWIFGGGKAAQPWDQKDFKAPSGSVFSPGGMMIWPPANAIYRRETYDNYPAAKAILHSVYEGLQLPMDQALTVEARWFAHILRSKEAAAMIRSLFLSKNELDKGAHRPERCSADAISRRSAFSARASWAPASPMSAPATGSRWC